MATLKHHRDGFLGYVTISNPSKLNAMTRDMWMDFPRLLKAHEDDGSVRVIVIQGEGKEAFSSGADISEFGQKRQSRESTQGYNDATVAAYSAPARLSKPVLAKVSGVCIGGGLALAAACDVRICSTSAIFRMPAARIGLGYEPNGLRRFVQLIGLQNTLDLFFSARKFDGAEAVRIGFASTMHDESAFETSFKEYADVVANNAPLTLASIKRSVEWALGGGQGEIPAHVQAAVDACNASSDYREAVAAFADRRTPTFRGL